MRLIPTLVLTILLSCGTFAQAQGVDKLPNDLMIWMKQCCVGLEVEPEFVLAVARVESGNKDYNFRLGKMGKTYYGPMGIHKCFLQRWPIDDPKVNIQRGVIALRGTMSKEAKYRRLHKYNTACNSGYLSAVMHYYQFYKDTHIFNSIEVANAKILSTSGKPSPNR